MKICVFIDGIAGYKTIGRNHKLTLKGNPVHEDMEDATKAVNQEISSTMTVLDKHHKGYTTICGHIHNSFHAAIDQALEEKGDQASVLFLMGGWLTVPMVK